MRISKKLLLGSLIAFSLAVCSVFAQAVPDTGIGLHAQLLPKVKSVDTFAVVAAPISLGDQLAYKFVANTNLIAEASLDIERQVSSLISQAYLEADAKTKCEQDALMAYLLHEVGWYTF